VIFKGENTEVVQTRVNYMLKDLHYRARGERGVVVEVVEGLLQKSRGGVDGAVLVVGTRIACSKSPGDLVVGVEGQRRLANDGLGKESAGTRRSGAAGKFKVRVVVEVAVLGVNVSGGR
jgi:hypothetical protein